MDDPLDVQKLNKTKQHEAEQSREQSRARSKPEQRRAGQNREQSNAEANRVEHKQRAEPGKALTE